MKRIIVNGVFDILHVGHVSLLQFAKSHGDHLVIAIDSDERIRQNKNPKRPIYNEQSRKFILENIKNVDEVIIFNNDEELLNIIRKCNLMIKGSDYINKSIIGQNIIPILFFNRLNEYSTTKTIESITSR